MSRSYSHRSKDDLRALEADLAGLSLQQKAIVAVGAMHTGIMRTPWLIKIAFAIARLRHGSAEGLFVFACAITKKPDLVDALWRGTLLHMVDGKDAYDRLSAGGWNKQELDVFLKIAETVGWRRPPVPEAA